MRFMKFKLSKFDNISMTFRELKGAYDTLNEARAKAKNPGKYRVSANDGHGTWVDADMFTIEGVEKTERKIPFANTRPTAASLVHGKRYGK